ncbi:cellulase family glycosylhydrolase [Plebeiibacterium marinum]|uniref:Cellulase family glycosylhydrolase n=1 Tax=Plebeiibacterium marinum TaxID=2992111 RepID=A0AAE3MF54_9BACT|nr:cellulase family glycosylhydrolase [Plebeiobacterium marinum]MCW3806621.1 cellulase family glycosylhydrolase [Plebeiobacterium marinum]
MKLHHILFSIWIGVMFFGGCSKDETTTIPELVLSVDRFDLSKAGESKTFHIKSNVDWSIESSETWCTVMPLSGFAGTNAITITSSENTSYETRESVVTVKAGDLSKTLTVSQNQDYLLALNQASFNILSDGGDVDVSMQISDDFNVEIDVDWISQKSLKSVADSILTFKVEANNTTLSRQGNITFTLNDITETAVIKQSGIDISIPADETGVESDAMTLASKMIVGWNIGNSMEVPGGETLWGNPVVSKQLIDGIKDAGFNAIRIPCAWDSYLEDQTNYKIKDEWLARVKEVVDYCVDNQMYTILNIHWDGGWLEEHPMYEYQDEVNRKQEILWKQIAVYFRDYDEHLLFAGTNEVRKDYNTPSNENIEVQESYVQTFVDAVRATGGKNAYRNLVVQTYNTVIDHGINLNTMPVDVVDNRLILEVHYYDPYDFTIKTDDVFNTQWGQGYADVSNWGQEDYLEAQFQKLKTKYIDNDIPVIIGEYSAMLRGDMSEEAQALHEESRNYYHKKINEVAKAKGITTFYWDNGYTTKNASGLFNRATGEPVHTDAIEAIVNVYK